MKVKFLPQNISVDVEPGKSVMELARENKLPVSSSCNGMCACAECRVYIVEGEAHILPPSSMEVELIGGGYFIDNRRLSCQLFCFGDVTVDLSEQVERQKQEGTVKKQFLKRLSKGSTEESSSVGGIMVEQDKEMNAVHVSESEEADSFSSSVDDFYKKDRGQAHIAEKGWRKKWNNDRREEDTVRNFQSRDGSGSRSYRKKNKRGTDRNKQFNYGRKGRKN